MKVSLNVLTGKTAVSSNLNHQEGKKNSAFGINLKSLTDTIPRCAREIEKDLFQKYDMEADFQGNDLIANCIEKTTKIFSEIFGKDYLPNKVGFKNFNSLMSEAENVVGVFFPSESGGQIVKNVYVNSDCMSHYNATLLNINAKIQKWIVGYKSTGSPLQTFVHEFVHCAHFANVSKKGNSFEELAKFPIPELHFRIINAAPLGKYAFEGDSVHELAAEALTRQILNYPETIKPHEPKTLFDYYDIYDAKGKKYMQAIWDGDVEKLKVSTEEVHIESTQRNWDDHVDRTEYVMAGLGL